MQVIVAAGDLGLPQVCPPHQIQLPVDRHERWAVAARVAHLKGKHVLKPGLARHDGPVPGLDPTQVRLELVAPVAGHDGDDRGHTLPTLTDRDRLGKKLQGVVAPLRVFAHPIPAEDALQVLRHQTHTGPQRRIEETIDLQRMRLADRVAHLTRFAAHHAPPSPAKAPGLGRVSQREPGQGGKEQRARDGLRAGIGQVERQPGTLRPIGLAIQEGLQGQPRTLTRRGDAEALRRNRGVFHLQNLKLGRRDLLVIDLQAKHGLPRQHRPAIAQGRRSNAVPGEPRLGGEGHACRGGRDFLNLRIPHLGQFRLGSARRTAVDRHGDQPQRTWSASDRVRSS